MSGTSTHHQVETSESGEVQARQEADVEWIRESRSELALKVGGAGVSTVIRSLVSIALAIRTTEW